MAKKLQTKTLMIQGTTSDAGKSVLVAGLCRVLQRRGVLVAPFKPQNMALNSAVTVDGGEIGRAQALQAQACGLEPHSDMNPILLKPSSDTAAQVIVQGKPLSSMEAANFHDYKSVAMQAVLESHQRLCEQYDTIVVEGAGSPAEINLRDNDIANMGFAEAVDCPVILVADIDRGGVFAHLVGTLELLSKSEQQRVIGFVINRFRGDIGLLQPGLDWLAQKTAKPVLGVLPYLKDFYLDAEDAINQQQLMANAEQPQQRLNIVVPVLSRISNHTDFDALRLMPQVNLLYVSVDQPIPDCDLVILPGSKNVRRDLQQLKAAGWSGYLSRHLRYGGKLLGICGGFQMLGNVVHDPNAIEGEAGSTDGFAFLDINTELQQEKQLLQRSGWLSLDADRNTLVTGYEIHCGISEGNALTRPLVRFDNGECEGAISTDDQIMGTYLHGLFDNPVACKALLQWAGLNNAEGIELNAHREMQLNRLADTIESSLDLSCLGSPCTEKTA